MKPASPDILRQLLEDAVLRPREAEARLGRALDQTYWRGLLETQVNDRERTDAAGPVWMGPMVHHIQTRFHTTAAPPRAQTGD